MESHGILRVKVLRKGGCKGKVSCEYSTHDGSAVAPSDYTAVEGKLDFEENELEKIIDVKIIDDDIYEQDETYANPWRCAVVPWFPCL